MDPAYRGQVDREGGGDRGARSSRVRDVLDRFQLFSPVVGENGPGGRGERGWEEKLPIITIILNHLQEVQRARISIIIRASSYSIFFLLARCFPTLLLVAAL